MTHLGQCPCCHHFYELDEADIGCLLQCECGVTLFCCQLLPSARLELICEQCAADYEVSGEIAGRTVECECGQRFAVPTVLLRPPMASLAAESDGELAADASAPATASTEDDKATSEDAAGDAPDSVLRIDTSDPPARQPSRHDATSSRKRKTDIASWAGFAAIAVLLVVAIVMFMRRNTARQTADESADRPSAAEQIATQDVTPTRTNAAANRSVNLSDDLIDVPLTSLLETNVSVVAPDPQQAGQDPSEVDSGWSDRFPIPPAPRYALPKPQDARPRIPISTEKQPYMTLRSGVQEAFDAYEETQDLMLAAEQTSSDADRQAYEQSLGRTLALVQHVHDLAAEAKDVEQLNSMRYLLAYLYYSAGHLPESCIMGQAVARWGDLDEPATKEGAMIALAAAREASDTLWGIHDQLGELALLESIADLFAKRWPGDDQLGMILMDLGSLYEAYNQPGQAVNVYQRIPEESSQYGDALVASGLAQWLITRRQAIEADTSIDNERMRQAQRTLQRGLRAIEKKEPNPDRRSIEVRVALAQIALINRQVDEAAQWLTIGNKPIVDRIQLAGANKKGQVVVSEYTARQIFDALYYLHLQRGEPKAANQILERMTETIESVEIDLEAQWLSTVKRAADRLVAKPIVTRADINEFSELAENVLDDEARFPTDQLLWLAETWGKLADKAQDPKTKTISAGQAADIYGIVTARTDFPAASMQSAQLRRIEWLQRSGDLEQSLRLIEDLLAKTPNVFSIQIAAAECLQRIGVESGKVSDLQAAINGPQGFSSIWGWAKLVSTLHATRWSARGTQTHAEQLLLAQFRFAQCQLLVAQRTNDGMTRRANLASISRSLKTILATMKKSNPWYAKFQQLQAAATKLR